jgi:nucleoprotein TPR
MAQPEVIYSPVKRTTIHGAQQESKDKFLLLSPKQITRFAAPYPEFFEVEYELVEKKLKVEELQSERAKWEQTVTSKLGSLETKVATLETENTTLKTKTATLETENTTLKTKTATMETKVATLETENTTLKTKVATLETENTTLKTKMATLTTEKNNLKEEVQTLTTDFLDLKRSVQEEGQKLEQQVKHLKTLAN